ncbi:hypothetical protein EG329_013867 [Mollisiaceae sp. DMI_Dod_QoI]|nr:hypothetical protein EG329_013867 [Helotiales sp. DMI_Dod_QoI]
MIEITKKKSFQSNNTSSDQSLALAFKWLSDCAQSHEECRGVGNKPRRLPTRLIDVGILKDDTVKLCDTKLLPLDTLYLTLSHCWGTEKFLTLTTENITSFKEKGFRISHLPKTFQDAVYITQSLPVRYIWIDSLCIVQNSKEDWQKESVLMEDVYSNGYCNIAATAAPNSQAGFFVERNVEFCHPLTINVPSPSLFTRIRRLKEHFDAFSADNYDQFHEIVAPGSYEIHDDDLWKKEVTSSTLSRRAWVFQERLLSPRVLHFTSSQIFFECQKTRRCELYPEGLPSRCSEVHEYFSPEIVLKDGAMYLKGRFGLLHSSRANEDEDFKKESAFTLWYRIVEAYTLCQLTYETDRLIAIAGLARHIQPILNCRYLAGLWDFRFVHQLCWQSLECVRPEDTYQAPTWSWASRPTEASYSTITTVLANPSTHIKIQEVEVVTNDDNEMSQAVSGYLRATGELIPVHFKEVSGVGVRWLHNVRGRSFKFIPDIPPLELSGTLYCTICLIGQRGNGDVATGLVLRPTRQAIGQYHRVGFLDSQFFGQKGMRSMLGKVTSAEKAQMTEDLYETFDEETNLYTFTIV